MKKITKSILLFVILSSLLNSLKAQVADSYFGFNAGFTSYNNIRMAGFYSIRPDFPTIEHYNSLGGMVGGDYSILGMAFHSSKSHFSLGDYFGVKAGIGEQFSNVDGKGIITTQNIYGGAVSQSDPAIDFTKAWFSFDLNLGFQSQWKQQDDWSFGGRIYLHTSANTIRQVVTDDDFWAMGIFGQYQRYSVRLDWKYKNYYVYNPMIHFYTIKIRRAFAGKNKNYYLGINIEHYGNYVPNSSGYTYQIDPSLSGNKNPNKGSNTNLTFVAGFMLF